MVADMTDERVPVPTKRVAARIIGGKALLLDPRADELRRLNDVGSFIWGLIEAEEHSVEAITVAVVDEFDIEYEDAAQDLGDFLTKLQDEGFVEFRGASVDRK